MSDAPTPELRAAYRTLNEPTRLLGLSISGWAWLLAASGAAYGWLLVSPLPWRANVSLAAILLGLPVALLLLREQSTITPARLLAGVVRWRCRPALLVAPGGERPVRRGGVRLDRARDADDGPPPVECVPWPDADSSPGAVR